MEMMSSTLLDFLPTLQQPRSKVTFGHMAVRLLDIIEAFHRHQLLVRDVKPDNFMIAESSRTAPRICMVDLGLVDTYAGVGGHRPNEGSGTPVGTPLYVSLNVQGGDTPSRRDDMEALGYMLADLRLRLIGNKSLLPWAKARSDEELFDTKLKTMTTKSLVNQFYSSLGNGSAAVTRTFQEFFDEVMAMKYSQAPDYVKLRQLCRQMDEDLCISAAAAPTRKTAARRGNAKSTRGTKRQAPTSRNKASKAQVIEAEDSDDDDDFHSAGNLDHDEDDFHSVENVEEDDDFHTCIDGNDHDDLMDWEDIPEKDIKPKAKSSIGVSIVVTDGPNKGLSFRLLNSESLVIGSSNLAGDSKLDEEHLRFTLKATRRLKRLIVRDLGSSVGTRVNGKKIAKGREQIAFMNDKIAAGESILSILPLSTFDPLDSIVEVESTNQKPVPHIGTTDENRDPSSLNGLKLLVTEGPQKGETFDLTEGGTDFIILGHSSKDGHIFGLGRDDAIDAKHATVALRVRKGTMLLQVTDLGSSTGTCINGRSIRKESTAALTDLIQVGKSTLKVVPLEHTTKQPLSRANRAARRTEKQAAVTQKTLKPSKNPPKAPKRAGPGLCVEFVEGPHLAESIVFNLDDVDCIVLGSKPRMGNSFVVNDSSLAPSHLKIELDASKKTFLSLLVSDLKGTVGVSVNKEMIRPGKKKKAFINDRITFGESCLKVKKM